MIETPPSFAATPETMQDGQDLLTEMLRAVRLTGSVFLNASFTAPFGVVSPKRYDDRTPMAHLRHVSVFHLIAAGSCTIEIATGERRTISTGDILLLPFADVHTFWNGERRRHGIWARSDAARPGEGNVDHQSRRRRQ